MKFFILLAILWSSVASADLTLPADLNAADRRQLLAILGYGTQTRLLSSPVPLGGYQGFEVGVSEETVPIHSMTNLGSGVDPQDSFSILNLSFGKGFAYNIDGFVQFTPIPQVENMYSYGGAVRWGFYEFPHFPAVLSAVAHASSANYMNQLDARTMGIDLIATFALRDFSLYFGGGPIQAYGTFLGGGKSLVLNGDSDSSGTASTTISNMHSVAGVTATYNNIFLAVEVDYVIETIYGARLGLRL